MKIVFMGTPRAAVASLGRVLDAGHEVVAVYTQPDRPAGRGNKLAASAVKEFAIEHGLSEIRQPLKIKTDEAFEEFRSLDADAAVVVAYGRILPERWLNAFPAGAINVHFSLLPKYRGAAPVNWAIANGEAETGVTTMKMDAGLDTGDILLQRATPIGADETAVELMDRLAIVGAELLIETLDNLDRITPRRQDDSLATLAPIMKKEDGRIDWTMSAREIANRVRAFQPFPTSYTFADGVRYTIWRAAACETGIQDHSPQPGTVIEASGGSLSIACGSGGVLRVDEIQPEGKRRMAVRDFLNGAKLRAGMLLG
ncbi:MAG: methionyl-tRNA formyltransferase [Pyrinomonadaceae bacterium]